MERPLFISSSEPLEAIDDHDLESEPEPVSTELLTELLTYIHHLWDDHYNAKREQLAEQRIKTEADLVRAYLELLRMNRYLCSDHAQQQINPDVIVLALEEISSWQNLRKVIKLQDK